MVTTALVLVGLAALVHVWVFVLESLAWTSPRARATFGTTPEQARATRQLAFNQGFYNLFLALVAGSGALVLAVGGHAAGRTATAVGTTLALTGVGSMAAAGLVLALSDPTKRRAALVQAGPPLLGCALLAAGLVTR